MLTEVGMRMVMGYPFILAIAAKAIPVLPDEGSTMR